MDLFTLTPSFHTLPLPKPRHLPQPPPSFHHQLHPHRRVLRCSTTMPTTASSTVQFDLRGYWTSLIDEINTKLDESIPVSYPEGIYEAMRYSVLDNAAKRAPPVMCITACELFGGHRRAAFPTACALEMVHSASLIHDDLPCMDNDPERRGHPANHVVFGEDMAILAGDALFPLGFRHIVTHTPPELVPETQILKVIAEIARCVGSTGMAAGQIVDLEDGPNMVDYIQDKKFGELAECSAVCGGLLAGANEDEIQRLRRYGRAVGVLYHLVDDILKEKSIADKRDESKKKRGKNYVSVYGVEKAMEVAEDLRAQAKRELDGFGKYGEKVDYACTPEEVQQHFQSCGIVNRVTILTDKFGQPKGFAYVEFVEQEAVQQALLLNESELHGRQLKVSPKRTNVPGLKQFRGRRFNPYMPFRPRRPFPSPYFNPYGYGKAPRFRRPNRYMPYY